MSRVPSTRAPPKLSSTPARTRVTPTTPSKNRTQPAARSGTPTKAATSHETAATTLSIKEVIALRRAEAKKAQAKENNSTGTDSISLDDPSPSTTKQEEEDILGRWPLRETIERARSTGDCCFACNV
jgi:hypothetical protein